MYNLSCLENQILKDKIVGLHDTMKSLLLEKSDLHLCKEYLNMLISYAKKIENELEDITKQYYQSIQAKDETNQQVILLFDSNTTLTDAMDKIISKYKQKVQNMKETNEKITEEREKFKISLETSESNLKIVTDELDKLRQKIKQVKFRQGEDENEKICKNCKKIYNSQENFNWSCKIHSSLYSGEIWWCCGKSGSDAPGCKICMHESGAEYERPTKEDEKKMDRKTLCSVICN